MKEVKPTRPHEKLDLLREAPLLRVTEMAWVKDVEVKTFYGTGLQYHTVVSSELAKPGQLTDETIEIP